MSQANARRWLWIAALVTLPVPFYLGEPEWAPAIRLAFLTGLLSAVALVEGGTSVGILSGLGAAQTVVYAFLLWLVAALLARGLGRLGTPLLRGAAVVLIAAVLVGVSLTEIYHTPLSSTRPRSNLTQIFE